MSNFSNKNHYFFTCFCQMHLKVLFTMLQLIGDWCLRKSNALERKKTPMKCCNSAFDDQIITENSERSWTEIIEERDQLPKQILKYLSTSFKRLDAFLKKLQTQNPNFGNIFRQYFIHDGQKKKDYLKIIGENHLNDDSYQSGTSEFMVNQTINKFLNKKKMQVDLCIGCAKNIQKRIISQIDNQLCFDIDDLEQKSFSKEKINQFLAQVCCMLNEGGNTFFIKKLKKKSQQSSFKGIRLNNYQKQRQDWEIQRIISQKIFPSKKIQIKFNYVWVNETNMHPQSQILCVNVYPTDPTIIFSVVHQKNGFSSKQNHLGEIKKQCEIIIRKNEDKSIGIPMGEDKYKMIVQYHKMKQLKLSKCSNFKCIIPSQQKQNFLKDIKIKPIQAQKNIIHPYQFSYIIILGSINKMHAKEKAENILKQNRILYKFSIPYQSCRTKSQRIVLFLSTSAKFKQLSELLKKDDHENLFHSIIVANQSIKVDLRFPSYRNFLLKLQDTLIEKFPNENWQAKQDRYDAFSYYYCFRSVELSVLVFCILDNEGHKGKFIRKSDYNRILSK